MQARNNALPVSRLVLFSSMKSILRKRITRVSAIMDSISEWFDDVRRMNKRQVCSLSPMNLITTYDAL